MARTRRSAPRRPRIDPVPETGGPIRPTQQKKSPPKPTGKECAFGIACRFGVSCVNAHAAHEAEFFKKRELLKLQLKEMNLQVEQIKVEKKKALVQKRQPLGDMSNSRQVSSNRGASTPKTRAKKAHTTLPTHPSTKQQSVSVLAAAQVRQAPARPQTPDMPPPASNGCVFVSNLPSKVYDGMPQGSRPHETCVADYPKTCGQGCVLDAGHQWCGVWRVQVDNDMQVPGYGLPYWGEPADVSVAKINGQTFDVYHAAYHSPTDVWVFSDEDWKWYPVFNAAGRQLLSYVVFDT